jgi:hypothetical protein
VGGEFIKVRDKKFYDALCCGILIGRSDQRGRNWLGCDNYGSEGIK